MSDKNIFQKIGAAVADYAPALSGVLSAVPGVGTLPAVAVSALGSLCRSFGLGNDSTPEDILATVTADPESRLKLYTAESNFKLESKRLDLEQYKAALLDVQGARVMKTEETKATGKRDVNLYLLAWLIVLGFFALTGLLIFKAIPEGSSQAVYMLFGGLVGYAGAVIQFFFGSSKSSQDKTELMASK
jgi:hypothetical protein